MHFYGMSRPDIDNMNQVEIQGWLAMIPDLQEKFGKGEVHDDKPGPGNLFMPTL